MSKYFLTACLCMFLVSGCAGSSESESMTPAGETPVVQEPDNAAAPAPKAKAAESKKKGKKEAKSSKSHAKSESVIREELNAAAARLVSRASRTITPSKSNKSVRQSSKGYVAQYIYIDPANYSTDMRPASKAGQYVGFIRYTEQTYQCHGKTKKEALAASCSPVSSRRLNEMIHYDGSQWRD